MATAQATPQLKSEQDTRRITEGDADYQRLRAATVRRLTASVRSLLADLCHGTPAQDAANAFARRHTDLLKQAYLAADQAGARDYYDQVSRTPGKWAARVQPSERVMVQRILFYAAGSVLKMANEAVQAWHDTQTAAHQLAEPARPIQDYFTGLSGRLNLQGEIAWSGLNDGYTDAGQVDPASPYAVLYWDLGPVKTQHCGDCPRYAAASPYDRPGSGGNELDATPGDGHTECGAACHCSLRYGMAPTAEQAESVWQQAKGAPPTPPGSLKWPNAPRPTQEELDAHQQKLLDDYRTQFDRWEAVRGDLPSLPDLFGTQGSDGWVTWDALTPAQQTVLSDVFGVLSQVDAAFGHPSLEEAAAAFGAAQEDLAQFLQQLRARAEHLDQFLQDLQTASQQDWEEWFGKGPVASWLWNTRQDWYDTLEWFLSRTEPPNAQMAERYIFVGGHPPGYTQNRDRGGRWAPGEGRGEGEGGGGGVHAPHGMAAAHGRAARGGRAGGGGGGTSTRKAAQQAKLDHLRQVEAEKFKALESAGHQWQAADAAARAARGPGVAGARKASQRAWDKMGQADAEHRAARTAREDAERAMAAPSTRAVWRNANRPTQGVWHNLATVGGVHPMHQGQPDMPRIPDPGSRLDEHGQRLPFAMREFDVVRLAARPTGELSLNPTEFVTIGGKEYLVKAVDNNVVGRTFNASLHDQQRNEAATVEAMKALGYGHLVASEAYHVVGSDGRRYSVQSRESGDTINHLKRAGVSDAEIGQHVSAEDLQKAYLGEYLLGMRDRHGGNLLYDPATGRLIEIDHGFGFHMHPGVPEISAVRKIWEAKVGVGRPMTFSRAVLHDALHRQAAVEAVATRFGFRGDEMTALRSHFDMIRHIANDPRAPTAEELANLVGTASRYIT